MTTDHVATLYAGERDRFTGQLSTLDATTWNEPSLCAGWTVRDLCAHLLMPYELGVPSFLVRMVRARFDFDKLADRWATDDRRSGAELATAIGASTAAGFNVPGAGELAPLAHLLIHGHDVRGALGLDHRLDAEAATLVLNDLTAGKHSVGEERLAGLRFVASDAQWSHGEGPEVVGDASVLLSALNGRTGSAGALGGDGASEFRTRLT